MKREEIIIPLSYVKLKGELVLPENAGGIVIFSHGSGSNRFSPRNKMLGEMIQQQGIATLLFDLITEEEDDRFYNNRFNIDLLVSSLIEATEWVMQHKPTKSLPVAYFGANSGAASALRAAAYFGKSIKAVVSRGGRPDLALHTLPMVSAPTLLLVGQMDVPVIKMNKLAFDQLNCIKEMKIIPGATHLFEEPGKLLIVAEMAIAWYKEFLVKKGDFASFDSVP